MSADRDHEAEPQEVQCHNALEKEEEADPDLEFECTKEAEEGRAPATDPMHHVHEGPKAKMPYPKAKIKRAKIPRAKIIKARTKAKAKIPKAKIGKVKTKVPKGNMFNHRAT